MRSSQETNEIYAAINEAMSNISKAKKTSDNPYYQSSYADLGEIYDSCVPALEAQGILVHHPLTVEVVGEGANAQVLDLLSTRLYHNPSGQYIESTIRLFEKDVQKRGSEITYFKRYTLSAMLRMTSEEDDDGNAASKAAKPSKPASKAAPSKASGGFSGAKKATGGGFKAPAKKPTTKVVTKAESKPAPTKPKVTPPPQTLQNRPSFSSRAKAEPEF